MVDTCPKCSGPMVEKLHGDNMIKIDRCKQCNGLWFDEGELAMLKQVGDKTADFWSRPSNPIALPTLQSSQAG